VARDLGVPHDLPQAVDRFNDAQISWLANLVADRTSGSVGILGLAYKPGTDVLDNSAGLLLARELVRRGYTVSAYDPAIRSSAAMPEGVSFSATAKECVINADLVVVATAWPEFASLESIGLSAWARPLAPRVIVDCWRVLGALRGTPGIAYVGLGLGESVA
jgi:UDPglucose 6-dehydrogenase